MNKHGLKDLCTLLNINDNIDNYDNAHNFWKICLSLNGLLLSFVYQK